MVTMVVKPKWDCIVIPQYCYKEEAAFKKGYILLLDSIRPSLVGQSRHFLVLLVTSSV